MFLTYINELVSVLEQHNIKVKLFADDVKMYVRILDDFNSNLNCTFTRRLLKSDFSQAPPTSMRAQTRQFSTIA